MSLPLSKWLELLESRHPKTIDLGLERCTEVWRRMGSPQVAERVITVAGTNGKGSTVAYLSAMLQELGHTHGCYTSPHLLNYTERIRINGKCCEDAELISAFELIESVRGEISLTYFEFGTLAAISIMSRAKLEFAVMEVGLGGRLDAVNILDADCAVITPIGLDHQDYLGPDLDSIGREKAGIIRPGMPVVCGEAQPPASIVEVAARREAPVWRLGREFDIQPEEPGFRFSQGRISFLLPVPAMAGVHQVGNMATALAALLLCVPGAQNHQELLARALQGVRLAGRMQQLSERPLLWVDVGHNPLAAEGVARVLGKTLAKRPGSGCHCVIGMLRDKDPVGVAKALRPFVSRWYCAGLTGERGQSGSQLAERIGSVLSDHKIIVCADVASALDRVLEESLPEDCILVFGSFLTAAAAITRWQEKQTSDKSRNSPANSVDTAKIA